MRERIQIQEEREINNNCENSDGYQAGRSKTELRWT